MTKVLTLTKMRSNVALSQDHVIKQETIIARLSDQGHSATIAAARALLVTMHAHLALEVEMLARIEAAARSASV